MYNTINYCITCDIDIIVLIDRDYCLTHPQSLPKLLSAVKWNDRDNVAQVCLFFTYQLVA